MIEEENIQRVRRIEEDESEDTFVRHGPSSNSWTPKTPKGPRYPRTPKPRAQQAIPFCTQARSTSEAAASGQWSAHAEAVSSQPESFSRVYAGAQHSGFASTNQAGPAGVSRNQPRQVRSNVVVSHRHGPSQVNQSISVAVDVPQPHPNSGGMHSWMSDEMLDTYAEIERLRALTCQIEELEHKDRQLEFEIETAFRRRHRDSTGECVWRACKKQRKAQTEAMTKLFAGCSSENKTKAMVEMSIDRRFVLINEQTERHNHGRH